MNKRLIAVVLTLVASVFVRTANAEKVWNYKGNVIELITLHDYPAYEDCWFLLNYHDVVTVTETPNGGYHLKWNTNANGSGTSNLGVKYQMQNIDNYSSNWVGNTHEETWTSRFKLEGQGTSDNYWYTIHYKFVYANGEVRVDRWIEDGGWRNG